MQRGTYGFWRGVLIGLLLALAAALAIAWFFPSLTAPEVDDSMQVAPAPPGAPGGSTTGPLLAPAAGPLVEGVPVAPSRPPAPAADAPAGSPSLVPAQ